MITLLLTLALAAAATPREVKVVDGAFRTQAGEPLYVFRGDTMVGMSHCEGACAVSWPPLQAAPQPQPSQHWTLVTRGDGSKQWAYRDRPLYTASLPYDRVKAATAPPDGLWAPARP